MRFLVALFVAIILCNLVIAQAPFEPKSFNKGCEIKFPEQYYLKVNQPYMFSFHLFNITDGRPLTNVSNAACELHLYNSSGNHIYHNRAIYSTGFGSNEWSVNIPSQNISKLGYYNYVFQCNSSSFGCGVTVPLEVNPQGLEYTTAIGITYIGIFGILVLLFMLFSFGAITIQGNNEYKYGEVLTINYKKYLKYFFVTLAYITFVWITYIAWNISWGILQYNTASNIFYGLFRLSSMLILPIIIGIIIFSIVNFFKDKDLVEMVQRNLTVKEGKFK